MDVMITFRNDWSREHRKRTIETNGTEYNGFDGPCAVICGVWTGAGPDDRIGGDCCNFVA